MAVHPGTTVSSGPGPPHVHKTTTLTYKKLPSEQTTTFNHQSTAKMVKLNTVSTIYLIQKLKFIYDLNHSI